MGNAGSAASALFEAVLAGDRDRAAQLAREALEGGVGTDTLLREALSPAMAQVGERFESKEIFLSEMIMSAGAMKAVMDVLRPYLVAQGTGRTQGTVVIGTVAGDIHDIGKNMVTAMLEGAGLRVIDLGISVQPAKFVEAVKTHRPDVLGLSALITTTMVGMRDVVRALQEAGVRDTIQVIVGGAPMTERFASEIGADMVAVDAYDGVLKVQKVVAEKEAR